jgi:hypothetical protein
MTLRQYVWWALQGVPPWTAWKYLRRNERGIARWLEENDG